MTGLKAGKRINRCTFSYGARPMNRILMTSFVSVLTLLCFTPAASFARDRIQITGSSTVFPFTTTVAERFGQKSGKTPIVESTGTGGGIKLFCARRRRYHARHCQCLAPHQEIRIRRMPQKWRDAD